MIYYHRTGLLVGTLTVALLLAGSAAQRGAHASAARGDACAVTNVAPDGYEAALDVGIVVTFVCLPDQRRVGQEFVIVPPVPGRFAWRGQTMIFHPSAALQPATYYRVTLYGGSPDWSAVTAGRAAAPAHPGMIWIFGAR